MLPRREQPAAFEDRDRRVELRDLGEVVRGVDDRGTVAREVAHDAQELRAGLDVGADGRLVEQYERRAADQRDGRVQSPPFAAGQLLGAPVEQLGEPERLGELVDRGAQLRAAEPGEAGEEPQVVAARQRRVHAGLLRREAEVRPRPARVRPRRRCRRSRPVPASALRKPATIDTSVVLPAPLRPSSAVISPAATSRFDRVQGLVRAVGLREPLHVEHAYPVRDGVVS